jgi:hypothetical protein
MEILAALGDDPIESPEHRVAAEHDHDRALPARRVAERFEQTPEPIVLVRTPSAA